MLAGADRVQMMKWNGWPDSNVELIGKKDWSPTTLSDPGSGPMLTLSISHHQFERYCSFYPGGDHNVLYENLGRVSTIHLASDMTDDWVYCIGDFKGSRYVFGKLLKSGKIARYVRGRFRDYLRGL